MIVPYRGIGGELGWVWDVILSFQGMIDALTSIIEAMEAAEKVTG